MEENLEGVSPMLKHYKKLTDKVEEKKEKVENERNKEKIKNEKKN